VTIDKKYSKWQRLEMKAIFKCHYCKTEGDSRCSTQVPFPHCGWYRDFKGLIHGCLYCRNCGAIYDTVGSITPIKLLFGKMGSKIVASYDFETMVKLTHIGNPETPTLRSMNPIILDIVGEDGRLDLAGDIEIKASVEELKEYLHDANRLIRAEADLALDRRFLNID
jgi:hypothetical protein